MTSRATTMLKPVPSPNVDAAAVASASTRTDPQQRRRRRRRGSSDEVFYGLEENESLGSFEPPPPSNSNDDSGDDDGDTKPAAKQKKQNVDKSSSLHLSSGVVADEPKKIKKDDAIILCTTVNGDKRSVESTSKTTVDDDIKNEGTRKLPPPNATTASTAASAGGAAAAAASLSLHSLPVPSALSPSSPSGRRPFRKRKGSVDFTLALEDEPNSTNNNNYNSSFGAFKRRGRGRPRRNSEDYTGSGSRTITTNFTDALPPMEADDDLLPSLLDVDHNDEDEDDDPIVGGTTNTAGKARASSTTTAGAAASSSSFSSGATSSILLRSRSRTNSSGGNGSANTAAAESLLSIGELPSPRMDDLDDLQAEATLAASKIQQQHQQKQNQKRQLQQKRKRKDSLSSHPSRQSKYSKNSNSIGGGSGRDAVAAAAAAAAAAGTAKRYRARAASEDNASNGSNSQGTLTSQSHRFLLEAFMGDGTESLVLEPSQRERLGSFDGIAELTGGGGISAGGGSSGIIGPSVRKDSNASHPPAAGTAAAKTDNSQDNNATSARDRFSSFDYGRRDRLESWGGMSDLSGHGLLDHNSDTMNSGTQSATAAALAASIYTSLANDVTAAAADGNESVSSFLVPDERIPTRISVNRDRLNSVASIATDPSALLQGLPGAHHSAIGEAEFPSDVQQYVKAAMASVGDQLADIAASAEAATSYNFKGLKDPHEESEISSTASPIIGATSDIGSKSGSYNGRPRANSVSSLLNIAVDYDAVAAAVDAAEAAAGAMDLTNLHTSTTASAATSRGGRKKRALPLQRNAHASDDGRKLPPSNSLSSHPELGHSGMDEKEKEELRAQARAAAGYVPPEDMSAYEHPLPPKKRAKMYKGSPAPPHTTSFEFQTPTISNQTSKRQYSKMSGSAGQANLKWDSMLATLVEYAAERKEEETRYMTEEQKVQWVWDGNVPTTYKTKDGKALGRWVNNQRSAKGKGALKEDREERLVAAGLKWTVQSSSSWNEMLEELKVYIAEQANQGKEWDGNVPTQYCIKLSATSCPTGDDDEKNLGRWVNRQRSMYQSGKLRKDRQLALERIGLKWSMLTSVTWESMYETLCTYVEEQKEKTGRPWDGNVPATYKTVNHDPPRALGRWVNRQRSAYTKSRLKDEYVAKLNEIGLKWSIHERRPKKENAAPDVRPGAVLDFGPEIVSSMVIAPPLPDNGTSGLPTMKTSVDGAQRMSEEDQKFAAII